jgi:hypothetical protein
MSEPRYVTNSELKTYRECRRKWWLSIHRQLQLKREKMYGPAASGTRVHRYMEVFYRDGDVAAETDFESNAEYDCAEYPEQAENIRKDVDLARVMIDGYLEWAAEEGEDEDYELVAPEARIEVALPGFEEQDVRLIGKLDQRVLKRSSNEEMFRDFKTVNDFSKIPLLPIDTQMKHYSLLLRLADKAARVGGGLYTMIRRSKRTARAKPPFFMNAEVRHNDTALRTYLHQVQQQVKEILALEAELAAGADAVALCYPNPTNDCSWKCEFLPVCSMFDDGSDAEGLTSVLYETGVYLSRYSDAP